MSSLRGTCQVDLNNNQANGGGGAGGSILLKAQTANVGTGLITANGGQGYQGGGSGGVGNGGVGRVRIAYETSATGSTTPTASTAQEQIPLIPAGVVPEQSTGVSGVYVNPSLDAKYTAYTYDPLDRITQITNPQGTTKTTSYDHWTQTNTDENGHQKKQYFNAYNKISQIDEINNGQIYTTMYTYDPLDNLTKIVDAKGNNFNFAYDTLNRKTSQTDPDLGTWHYVYDGVGNMTQQTDNRGKTTNKTYDQLDRVLTVTYPSDAGVNYTYDGNSKIGTLTSVTDAAGTVNYGYDNRLRKVQEQRVSDGTTWTTAYAHDAADRLLSTTKPDGEVVSNTYNAQGEIGSVGGILSNVDYNALNKITGKTYANGLTTNYTYNANDFRLNTIKTGALQDLSYVYDAVGNVSGTTDNVLSKTQSFGYDNLDRLTSATETGGYSLAYAYDAIGNMTAYSGLGTQTNYTYGNSTLVHAVSAVDSTTTVYDDALSNGWTDASFNTTNAVTSTNVYSGTSALASTIGAGGGLDLQAPSGFTTGEYTYVQFAVKASQAGQQYDVYADKTYGTALNTPVSLASYGGQPNSSGWILYSIPLEDLGATNTTIADIVLHNPRAASEPVVYVDQVKFLSGAVPTPMPTAIPTPTSTPMVTPTAMPTPTPTGSVNIAPSGTGYRWSQNSTATANTNRVAATGLNDGNLTQDVGLNGGDEEPTVGAWEAGGVVWSTTQTNVTSVKFKNGSWTDIQDGAFTANMKLQFTTDGTTWTDSGWSFAPSYAYDSSTTAGQTYTFTGSATSIKGARIVGQVHSNDTTVHSWCVNMTEIQVLTGSSPTPTITPTPTVGPTATPTPTGSVNIAPSGTGYRWSQNSTATANTNRVATTVLNDGNLTQDVWLNGGVEESTVGAWEAGGIVWSATQTNVTSVKFTNGSWASTQDGAFVANMKLQFTTNGTTWTDSGWSFTPTYMYDSSTTAGQAYTFIGSTASIKGARIVGQVHSSNQNVHSWYVNATEVQVFTGTPPSSGTNLALNKNVTALSVENSGTLASYAVDGDASTRWSTPWSDPQWLSIDLGSSHTINEVKLIWEEAYASVYQIQVSADGTTWNTIYSTTMGLGGTEDITNLSGIGRYIRIYCSQKATIWGDSLWEFAVYGA